MKEQQVVSIPIAEIRIVNPRSRNRLKWQLIVQSIETVGLKRPITVTKKNGSRPRRQALRFSMRTGQVGGVCRAW